MATIGGKIVTTNQCFTISGLTSKTLLYTAPSSGITKVFFVSIGMSGGANVQSNIYVRSKNPATNTFTSVGDSLALTINESGVFSFRELDYPTNGANKTKRLEGVFMILLPGEEIRYSNTNGNTHYINIVTSTQS